MAQQTTTITFSVVVSSLLQVTTASLPGAVVTKPYSASLAATGGTPPYVWSASGLPAGLTMSSAGVISGTPTATGTFSVVVTVQDAG